MSDRKARPLRTVIRDGRHDRERRGRRRFPPEIRPKCPTDREGQSCLSRQVLNPIGRGGRDREGFSAAIGREPLTDGRRGRGEGWSGGAQFGDGPAYLNSRSLSASKDRRDRRELEREEGRDRQREGGREGGGRRGEVWGKWESSA